MFADPRCGGVVEEQMRLGLLGLLKRRSCQESGSTHPKRADVEENGCMHVEEDVEEGRGFWVV